MFLTKVQMARVLLAACAIATGTLLVAWDAAADSPRELPGGHKSEGAVKPAHGKQMDSSRGTANRNEAVSVPGPTDLVTRVKGYILTHGEDNGIIAISLPTLKKTIVIPGPTDSSQSDTPVLHTLAGPDGDGRIAYIEDHFFVANDKDRRHLLKTIKLNGREHQELFTRPGDAMWSKGVGKSLALAPVGGRIALISNLAGVQMEDPPALLEAGALEIWDAAMRTGRHVGVRALDAGLSWFPDGKRLAYVELVPREKMAKGSTDLGDFAAEFKEWQRLPSVYVFDLETGKKTLLHVGWQPVISFDGKNALVYDGAQVKSRARLVNLKNGDSKSVHWPEDWWWGAFALLEGNLVLYRGEPGSPPRYTKFNSPLSGPKRMLTIRAAKTNSNRSQLLVPYLDPRSIVSFGVVRTGVVIAE